MAVSLEHVLSQIQRWTSSRLGELSDAELLELFVQRRDESAFAALAARHGAMVLHCCRRVLGDAHEAEDAFQAAFLILARKAHTLRQPQALPGFLHSVARRVALKARTKTAVRAGEKQLPEELLDPCSDPLARLTTRELLAVLDEEVSRLPAAQRSAVALCCLEGRTQEEAARMLGCTAGSLKGHLERGRRRLQARLRRRGIAVSAALAVVAASRGEGASALLLQNTIHAALGGGIGTPAAALAASVLKGMFLPKLAGMMALVMTAALAASTTVALIYRGSTTEIVGWVEERDPPEERGGSRSSTHPTTQGRTDALGDPLPEGAIARLGTVRFRHGGRIDRMLFTADGKHLISKGDDGVRVWDTATGKELRHLTPPPGENWSDVTDLSSDGEQLAVIHGSNNAIDLWNVRQGRKISSFGQGNYSLIRLSSDGKRAAVCAQFSGIELWDVDRREKLRSWKAHQWLVRFFVFTADSRRLLTSGTDGKLRLWDVATGRQLREFAIPNYALENLSSLPLSPDGSLLAVIEEEKPMPVGGATPRQARISVWDTATGKQVRQLTCSFQKSANKYVPRFLALTFTADGKQLLTSGPDHFLRVWDPLTGKELRKLPFGPRWSDLLALSKDGKTLAAGTGMAIRLLDLPSGKAYERPEGRAAAAAHPYYSLLTPDGRTAVTGSWGNALLVWDVATGRVRQQLGEHNDFLSHLQVSHDGKTLFSRDSDNLLRLWDLSRGEERSHVQLDYTWGNSERNGSIVSPDNRSLFLAGAQGIIRQLDAATGKERHRFQGSKWLWGMACSPDGRSLVGWFGDRKIRIWDAASGRLRHEYDVPREIKGIPVLTAPGAVQEASYYSAALSADGRLLAMGSLLESNAPKQKQQYALIFKDLNTGRDIAHCDPLPFAPEILVFSPDDRMLAWSGSFLDPAVHLLETASGRERRRLAGHRGQVEVLHFSATGERLLSASDDTTALVWNLGGDHIQGPATAAELEALWADLAGEDAARAYRAIQQFAISPSYAISFIRKRLRPIPIVDEKRLVRLIADLDCDEFTVRQKASDELAKLGQLALPAYRKVLDGKPSLESRRRLEDLREKAQRAWWDVSVERLRSLRAVEALELAGTQEARQVLDALAAGADGARLTEQAKAARQRLAKREGN